MLRRSLVAAALLLVAVVPPRADAQNTRPPIDMYQPLDRAAVAAVPVPVAHEWWAIDEISVAVLKPSTWVVAPKREDLGGWTYATRPRASEEGHHWGARFTMQVFWHPGGAQGAAAAREVFRALVNGIASDPACAILSTSSSRGELPDVTHVRMHLRSAPPGRASTLERKLFIADEHQGLVYVASFVAREDRWDSAWTVGAVMLERVLVGFKRSTVLGSGR